MPKYEFDFAMTCDGCSNAAKRVLEKIGVTITEDSFVVDMPNKKLYITSDKTADDLLEALRKTGKEVALVSSR